jgi:release factor glutamine methyltransferase
MPPTDSGRQRTLADVVARHARALDDAGVSSPEVDARLLARHVMGLGTAGIHTTALPPGGVLAELDDLVRRRAERTPLQLLTGVTWFRFLRVACRPGVFIPRPETEVVAGLAIDAAKAAGDRPLVVEPCTGTGVIALSVAAEVAGARVVASDRSPAAVELAGINLEHVREGHGDVSGLAPGATCEIVAGDLLDGVDPSLRGQVDVLVANPPYLPAGDRGSWAPEVAEHDPEPALVGGEDGHEVVDALLAAAVGWLAPGGMVVVEIDQRRGSDAAAVARGVGLTDVTIEKDLTGADRAVVGRRRHAAPPETP